jgi:REP element-mobilizing transposase RayT
MECGGSTPPLRSITKRMPAESPTIALRDWPHSPAHRLGEPGAYIITAGTHHKQHFFSTASRLTLLTDALLDLAPKYECSLQAWTVFPNHYHFVTAVPQARALENLIEHLHAVHSQASQSAGRSHWPQKSGFNSGIRISRIRNRIWLASATFTPMRFDMDWCGGPSNTHGARQAGFIGARTRLSSAL